MKVRFSLVFLFLFAALHGQSPDQRLVRGQINIAYLEHLVKEKVDSVRNDHNLASLKNDSILYVAAKDHTDYMTRKDLLTHYETDIPEKETPTLRVKIHGGVHFSGVGENILVDYGFIPVRDKEGSGSHTNETYDQLAYDMVNMWVHSPRHYQNIITPSYQLTGVAISYNSGSDKFYAAQVFGIVPGYAAGDENKSFFSYSNYQPPPKISGFDQVSHEEHSEYHRWGIKRPDDTLLECMDCINTGFRASSTSLNIVNGNIIFYTEETELMKLLLDNKTDGLVAEIVPYQPVDCENPAFYTNASRRNEQCIYNGKPQKPVYRKKLKRSFKKRKKIKFMDRYRNARSDVKEEEGAGRKWKAWRRNFYYPFHANYFQANLGKYPKNLPSGYYEINVLIIQQNRLCKVIHFTGFCGQHWDVRPALEDVTAFRTDSFSFQPKIRERQFTIPFEKNKTEYKYEDIKPFLDSLGSDKITVISAAIQAYASVEGSEEGNRKLQEQRANSIVRAMQSVQKDSIQTTIVATENWELFDKQVKTIPQFRIFSGKTHAEVKQMLNDTALNRSLEPWLGLQRRAVVKLTIKQEISASTSCNWLMEKWNQWMDSAAVPKTPRKHIFIDSLERMQGYYYRALLSAESDTSCLSLMKYPVDSMYARLYYHDAWMKRYMRSHANDTVADEKFYRELNRYVMAFPDRPYFPATYAVTRRWIEGWHSDGAYYDNAVDHKIIRSWLQWVQWNSPDSLQTGIDSLETAFHFSMVQIYKMPKDKNLRASELFWIYGKFQRDSMADTVALRLADYFTFYKYPELAASILEPYAMRENPHHGILMQYVRMRYVHYEDDTAAANDYYQLLAWSKTILTHEEWCSMFVGPCNISFQVFDHEATRDLYCAECSSEKNYAESPEKWGSAK
ncbi:MAG TPA: CAP domain-containing protein [Bacteroidia bacterium]|nr:CAP domain-containing protein [Bacteroidia bacterium]